MLHSIIYGNSQVNVICNSADFVLLYSGDFLMNVTVFGFDLNLIVIQSFN